MILTQVKTLNQLNRGEKAVLQVLLTGGRWTAVDIVNRVGNLQHNTCVKWLAYLAAYGDAGSIPYKVISQQEPGKHTHAYYVEGKAQPPQPPKKTRWCCPTKDCRADPFYWGPISRGSNIVQCSLCKAIFPNPIKEALS